MDKVTTTTTAAACWFVLALTLSSAWSMPFFQLSEEKDGKNNDCVDILAGIANALAEVAKATRKMVEFVQGKEFQDGVERVAKVASGLPKVIESGAEAVGGIVSTVEDVQGYFDQGPDLAELTKIALSVAANLVNTTLTNADRFLKTFNKRFECNTKCSKLKVGSPEREECDRDLDCGGFVRPKTAQEIEEEESTFVDDYDYEDYGDFEDDDDEAEENNGI